MIIIDVILGIIIAAGALALFAAAFGIFFSALLGIGQGLSDTADEAPGCCCFIFILLIIASIVAALIVI